MSNGAMSLEASVRTCDVNVGEANRIQSDRFFNPQNMVCIPWNGLNNKGQEVCPDSFWTKTPGCNSAEDRVTVENGLRPQYMSYITLNAAGVDGDIYGDKKNGYYGNVSAHKDSQARQKWLNTRDNLTGNFGLQFGADVQYQGCSVNAYERAMSQMSQGRRQENFLQNGYIANRYRQSAGGY